MFVPMAIANMAAGNIALRVGAKRYLYSYRNSFVLAERIQLGKHSVTSNMAILMSFFAGGTEATICEMGIAGFAAFSESTDPNRGSIPFDENRNGFVMGESRRSSS